MKSILFRAFKLLKDSIGFLKRGVLFVSKSIVEAFNLLNLMHSVNFKGLFEAFERFPFEKVKTKHLVLNYLVSKILSFY